MPLPNQQLVSKYGTIVKVYIKPYCIMVISHNQHPPKGDLTQLMTQQPLPGISGDLDLKSMTGEEPTGQVNAVLAKFDNALRRGDLEELQSCFYQKALFKDGLALTWQTRTFSSPSVIAAALLELERLRSVKKLPLVDTAVFNDLPGFKYIDQCLADEGQVEWQIYILSTFLTRLDGHSEDESLLSRPKRKLEEDFETDVFIIGGGNAAAALAARLKANGIDSVMAERNAEVGDNWARRYQFMKFHSPARFCDMPYRPYPDPERILTRDDLTSHLKKYVQDFQLNVVASVKIESTHYHQEKKRWVVKFKVGDNPAVRTAVSKHLVQATGFGSQKPYQPTLANEESYKGVNIHSHHYKDPAWLKQQRDAKIKSVLIIGSANTAFDVLEDLHRAGLDTTMVVRSDTYVAPVEEICHPLCLGAYSDEGLSVEACDRNFLSLPNCVSGQLVKMGLTKLALDNPDRYTALRDAGFPVFDSSAKEASLMRNLLERGGGHYVDIRGTEILANKEARVKNSEPVAYTEKGLRFSDGSEEEAEAIVWCTGYADKDARETVADILGGRDVAEEDHTMGPGQIADRVDPTWGVNVEGEVQGMWRRQSKLDNFWAMGGFTQQHRWFSRTLAFQIQEELEGKLPPAYLSTPC
ncbi:hypothetical protein IWX90DRAFT_515639 [Phyllosticta citrichinensis]|uniref:Flavin-containing monooxygenase n=1 Tax=Phyllosticta citrichinensis TaxID=1130410 RepID=A0ABR1XPF5_9PEZI